jgi:uncharacterized protein
LPIGQRRAVALFYLSGLTARAVAATLGTTVEAVKARLHKGRAALRKSLWELSKEEVLDMETQTGMLRMQVVDVRRGRPEVGGPEQYVVFLEEIEGARRLPIWIGSFEGTALAMTLERVEVARPGAYRFTANVLRAARGRLREVRIDRLVEGTFYAQAVLEGPQGETYVDSRPSDALNLALLEGAPVFVDPAVVEALERESARPLSMEGAAGALPDGPTEIVSDAQAKQAEALRSLRACGPKDKE